MKRHITCSELGLVKKFCLRYRSLQVTWDHWGHWVTPKWNLIMVEKLHFQVTIGQLRSCEGHLVISNSIDSVFKKTYEKTHNMPQREIWLKSSVYRSLQITWDHLGHLATPNSNMIGAINSASRKTSEKTYNMYQSEIWLKSYAFRVL